MPKPLTFRILDKQQGINVTEPFPVVWPLEIWLANIYDCPLNKFSVFNLARSCRQDIHVEHILPHCLKVLKHNVLAGELYDGELLCAVLRISLEYWQAHPANKKTIMRLAEQALRQIEDTVLADTNLAADINKRLARLAADKEVGSETDSAEAE